MSRWICPQCGPEKQIDHDRQFCPIHRIRLEEVPTGTGEPAAPPATEQTPQPGKPAPGEAAAPRPDDRAPGEAALRRGDPADACWNCDRPVEHAENTRCTHCQSGLTPPAVVLRPADGGTITVERGEHVPLGRCPEWSEHSKVFTGYPNVSRRHATIGVDGSGGAWLRNEKPTNGTFRNELYIGDSVTESLADGDRLRFGADFTLTVRIYPRGHR